MNSPNIVIVQVYFTTLRNEPLLIKDQDFESTEFEDRT